MSYCDINLLVVQPPATVAWALNLPARPAPIAPAPAAAANESTITSTLPPLPTEGFVRVNELADHLGVHRMTVHRWLREGYLPPAVYLSSRLVAWPLADIKNWIETRERRKPGPVPAGRRKRNS